MKTYAPVIRAFCSAAEGARAGPLSGIKVVEFGGLAPVPMAGMILADFGASVVRVDKFQNMYPDFLARGKRSVAVNLKEREGVEVVKRLTRDADVLIEPFRPGIMEKLGLGPGDLMGENPGLVYARLSGYGQDGPYSKKAGHDINYLSYSGVLGLLGRAGEKPLPPINLVADFAGGSLTCVIGIMMALHARTATGKGQVVDTSMTEGAAFVASMIHLFRAGGLWTDDRGTNLLDTGAPFYDTYRTKDGKFMAVGSIEPQFYAGLISGLGLEDADLPSQMDMGQWPALKEAFEKAFASKTRDEWCTVFDAIDACVTPVLDMGEVRRDPHAVARGMFMAHEDGGEDVTGESKCEVAPAPRLSGMVHPTTAKRCPENGDHSREVLKEAKYSAEDIERLIDAGVIMATPRSRL